ncbi:MAG: insulinase family protein [Clostridiales bacterium]|nr:insulinase family protein [Clostridiales bacterium]
MFDQITLPNGLRIVGEKLTHVRSCTVGVWVKVGSRNESEQENGLSHFIEHMVFKGTASRSARDIAEEMDMVGGQLNAFTGKECTCYYAKVIDEDLQLAVDILADLALRPTFDEKELNKERGVIVEEIAMVEDTPEDLVHELLASAQFTGSLSRPILGPASLIRSYTRDDLLAYWRKHYVPRNMVLSIAGNYDWEQFVALAKKYFDVFPNPDGEEAPRQVQLFRNERLARKKETEQLHMCLGFPGVEADHDDLYALAVFNNAIGGGMSSRLFQRIREELGMAYSVYTYTGSYQGVGVFNIYAGTTPENGETVLREIQEQLRIFLKESISEKEFLSAKAQLRGGYVLGLESSSGRMQSIGRGMLLNGRMRTPEETLAKIDAVTPEKVMEVARRVLSNAPCAAFVGSKAEAFPALVDGAPALSPLG